MTTSKPRRRIPWGWIITALVLAGAVGAFFFVRQNRATQAQAQQVATVETATAARGDFRVSVTGPGTLEAGQTLDVKPQVGGTILSLPKVGDRVTRGQLLVQLDRSNFQRNLDNAQLALEKARAQLESSRSNQTSGIASQEQSIANAQANFDNAQNTLESARTNLESTRRIFTAGGASQQQLNDAQRTLEQAQGNLESARVALSTARQSLSLRQSSNTQDLRNQQLAVEQAQLTLKNAQQDLANTKVFAPFSGVVSAVPAQVGGSASSGQALLTLIDDNTVNLPVQVDETEIGKVKVGQRAEVTLDALEGQRFEGTVTRISPSATIQQNIAVFYATVKIANPERKLKAGMSAEGEIISQEIPRAVTVPLRAVERVRTRAYVKVEGEAERRRIRVGPDDGVNIVVTSGLEAGEVVVLPTRVTRTQSTGTQRTGGGFGIPLGGPGR